MLIDLSATLDRLRSSEKERAAVPVVPVVVPVKFLELGKGVMPRLGGTGRWLMFLLSGRGLCFPSSFSSSLSVAKVDSWCLEAGSVVLVLTPGCWTGQELW